MPTFPTLADLEAAVALSSFDVEGAQRRMAPRGRMGAPGPGSPPPREASVLLYVFEDEEGLRFPLTKRRSDLSEHRGQVSLPGGRPEADETSWDTAVREAAEEIALEPSLATRVGALTPVWIPITHTLMHVEVARGPVPELEPSPREVEALGLAHVADLLDPQRSGMRALSRAPDSRTVPAFDLCGWVVWGATAIALGELAARLDAVR